MFWFSQASPVHLIQSVHMALFNYGWSLGHLQMCETFCLTYVVVYCPCSRSEKQFCFLSLFWLLSPQFQTIIASSFSSLTNLGAKDFVCVCLSNRWSGIYEYLKDKLFKLRVNILFFIARGSVKIFKIILLSSLDYGWGLIMRCVFSIWRWRWLCVVMVVGSCGGKSCHYCFAV